MTEFFSSVWWLIVALGVLVSVHEFGHFWVARRLGVKVLRFSIGFGQAVWRRVSADGCEYRIGWIPLGGYVKMLDEREGEVDPSESHMAFNRQRVGTRIAIVLAGPLINLLLALVLFWFAYMVGIQGLRPWVGEVSGLAADAGFRNGDLIVKVAGRDAASWEAASNLLLARGLKKLATEVTVRRAPDELRTLWLDLDQITTRLDQSNLLSEIGIESQRPPLPAVLESVEKDGPAAVAGLQAGDRIVAMDGQNLDSGFQWRKYLRSHPGKALKLDIKRGNRSLAMVVTPAAREDQGRVVGIIGVRLKPLTAQARIDVRHKYLVTERFGPLDALLKAGNQVALVTRLTASMIGRIVVGRASVKNLSGPVMIADYARQEADLGLSRFLQFLGLLSVSLFILNLLPIPVLDGGHLLYYFAELVRGKPLSQRVQMLGHMAGMALLGSVMVLVVFQDLQRLFG